MDKPNLTAERLRELLNYDPETGIFTWRAVRVGCGVGKIAGCIDPDAKYIVIKIDRRLYRGHRLAYLWMTGAWPACTIDHKDRNRSNNKWSNLRDATGKQNQENLPLDPRNTSGYRGVHWAKKGEWWISTIGHNGKKYVLGKSKDLSESVEIRKSGERRLFTHSEACEPQSSCHGVPGHRDGFE